MTQTPVSPPTHFNPDAPELFTTAPKWPKVIGILSIIFGIIAVLGTGLGAAVMPFMGKIMGSALDGAPVPSVYILSGADWGLLFASFALNILLVSAGFVLVGRKQSARMLHLVYAIFMIPMAFASAWVQMGKQEELKQWAIDFPDNPIAQQVAQQQQLGIDFNAIGLFAGIAFTLAWPLFCLIWFGLVKTKHHQMTGELPPEIAAFS